LKIKGVLITLMFFAVLFYPVAAAEPRPTVMITDYNVYPEVLMLGDIAFAE